MYYGGCRNKHSSMRTCSTLHLRCKLYMLYIYLLTFEWYQASSELRAALRSSCPSQARFRVRWRSRSQAQGSQVLRMTQDWLSAVTWSRRCSACCGPQCLWRCGSAGAPPCPTAGGPCTSLSASRSPGPVSMATSGSTLWRAAWSRSFLSGRGTCVWPWCQSQWWACF